MNERHVSVRPGPVPERVVILNDASVARGGATGLALLAARLLRARGLPVSYLCGDAGEAPGLREAGVRVVALGQARLRDAGRLRAMRDGLSNAAAEALVADLIEAEDSPGTVYHVHGWAQILSPSIFRALRPVAPRVLTHAHDMFLACPNGVYTDFPHRAVCTRVPLSWDCVRTQCDKRSYAQKLWRVARQRQLREGFDQRLDWGPVAMIHPEMRAGLERGGISAQRLHTLRNPARPWVAARIRAEENRGIVFVGRIDADKGAGVLAEAAAEAGVALTMVGEGPLRAELAARFPAIRFTGWAAPEEIGGHVAGARGLAMPSLVREPFGLVAAEASLSGLPVILPTTAMMSGEITSGGLGLAYDPQAPGALAATLAELEGMEAEEVARISGRGAARAVRLASTPDEWTDGLIGLYAQMLETTAPAHPDHPLFAGSRVEDYG